MWNRFESLILLGVPIGGADLARIINPLGWDIGMAKHLGKNRRILAEQITAVIPTLVVAGNTTVKHIFIANKDGKCKYAAFVGWIHSAALVEAIDVAIKSFFV